MQTKRTTFLLILLGLSTFVNAQSMTSITLLNKLQPYWAFLESAREDLQATTGLSYSSEIEQSYTFIQMELRDENRQLFLQVRYQLQHPGSLAVYSFYIDDKALAPQFEKRFEQLEGPFAWDQNPESTFKLSKKQKEYLEIADRIAALGNDIGANPSDYGRVTLTALQIHLEQINRRNATSLDNKDSYFLRDLYVVIPLGEAQAERVKSRIGSHYFGAMEVFFQDGSAVSQRSVGDKIMSQINEELQNYR